MGPLRPILARVERVIEIALQTFQARLDEAGRIPVPLR